MVELDIFYGGDPMDAQKLDMFIMTNQKFFPSEKIMYLKERLRDIDDEKFSLISTLELKDPTTILLVSIFLGTLGIDRFMIGDTGMGILKLLTGGLCGILTIIDWFTISNKTKELNFNKIMTHI
jgi:TM2 domain-containing membrane protein YozV